MYLYSLSGAGRIRSTFQSNRKFHLILARNAIISIHSELKIRQKKILTSNHVCGNEVHTYI